MNQSNQTQTPKTPKRATVVDKTIRTDSAGIAYAVDFVFPTMKDKSRSVNLKSLSAEIFAYAAAHGIAQKVGDAAAMQRNKETGLAASDSDKVNACIEVIDRLLGGQWNADREGGGNESLLFKALCRMYDGKRTPEQIKEFLAKKSDAEKVALATKNPEIAALIAEIRAEKVADIEAPDLSELDGDGDNSEEE